MRKIITTTFVTLDGVMQAPGGPEEDASGGFKYGGWQAHVMDDSLGEVLNEFLKPPFAMLLGRNTYDIFAGFWPKQDPNNAIAKPFNEATKYVVSHEPFEPDWVNTKVVSGDVPAALRRLKAADGPTMIVWGSGTLIQTLLREKLVDRMHLWTHPVKEIAIRVDGRPAADAPESTLIYTQGCQGRKRFRPDRAMTTCYTLE